MVMVTGYSAVGDFAVWEAGTTGSFGQQSCIVDEPPHW
jgi:hypothetical protein